MTNAQGKGIREIRDIIWRLNPIRDTAYCTISLTDEECMTIAQAIHQHYVEREKELKDKIRKCIPEKAEHEIINSEYEDGFVDGINKHRATILKNLEKEGIL